MKEGYKHEGLLCMYSICLVNNERRMYTFFLKKEEGETIQLLFK